ncbi:MAG: CotH kinase family protein [Candidatus Latescibacterota bacterium]|jgi:hypothetical protein
MNRAEKAALAGLTLICVVLLVWLGAAAMSGPPPSVAASAPFVADRVVTVRLVMAARDWEWLVAHARAEQYVRADFWYDGQRYANVAVRPKGNSSLMSVADSGSRRLSLKVDFNFFNSAQSFAGVRKLSLNNGFSDPTAIREMLGYPLFAEMGIPTPRCSLVDLYVNDTHLGLYTQVEAIDKNFLRAHFANAGGNLYKPELGAASLAWTEADLVSRSDSGAVRTEHPAAGGALVNLGGGRLGDLLRLMAREGMIGGLEGSLALADTAVGSGGFPFPGGPGGPPPGGPGFAGGPPPMGPGAFVPTGAVDSLAGSAPPWKDPRGQGLPPGAGWSGRGIPGGGSGRPGFGPAPMMGGFKGAGLLEAMGLKTNENRPNHVALFHLLEVLNHCPDETFPAEIEQVLDVDAVLRYLAVSVMMVHLDNYIGMGHNYYLYEVDGRFTILPWDLNMAFGTFGGGPGRGAADLAIDDPLMGGGDRPLARRLLAHAPYLERYHGYLRQLLEGGFADGVLEARIDILAALARPYVAAPQERFFTLAEFDQGLDQGSVASSWGGPPGFGAGGGPAMPALAMEAARPRPGSAMPTAGGQAPARTATGMTRRFRGGPGGPPGMAAPGLKSFLAKRRLSVRRQLAGEIPSHLTAVSPQAGQGFGPPGSGQP